jgi:hypothetical protein
VLGSGTITVTAAEGSDSPKVLVNMRTDGEAHLLVNHLKSRGLLGPPNVRPVLHH